MSVAPTTVATMKAFVSQVVHRESSVQTVPKPILSTDASRATDILVEIRAVATNPVDRKSIHFPGGHSRPIGYDAAGVVVELGSGVTKFAVGDEVYYSGNISLDGTFAEYHIVDSRIAALKPKSLSFTDAAAFPLVSITAYEALSDQLRVVSGGSLFILNGAGGVGSIAIQLAKKKYGLTVIASASRPETIAFVKSLGADYVVDHRNELAAEFAAQGLKPVNYVLNCQSEKLIPQLLAITAPRGGICGINGDAGIDQSSVTAAFFKNVSFTFELMFNRSLLGYEQDEQGRLLAEVAAMIDAGQVTKIATKYLNGLESISEAQELQTAGKAYGKTVITL